MDKGGFANMEKTRCSRRDVLRLAGAGVAAGLLPAFPRVPCWAQDLDLAFPRDGIDPEFSWVNQMQGPRPTHVWENWEDLLYDLETNPEPIIRAPEIQPFMKRVWVFNRTIQWHDEGLDGCLLSYSAGGDLMLTGVSQVSSWHSDPTNVLTNAGDFTRFEKKATIRCRDCTVPPALQFHLGQHHRLEVTVAEASSDWQFCL